MAVFKNFCSLPKWGISQFGKVSYNIELPFLSLSLSLSLSLVLQNFA